MVDLVGLACLVGLAFRNLSDGCNYSGRSAGFGCGGSSGLGL